MTGPGAMGPGLRQRAAADPSGSVWVSANAGSGKTKVLIDRVARLLLGGVAPERILCLTYTKAAAAEMQVRLFARLGGWAMLPAARLRAELADLVGDAVPDGALPRARRLFAQAIETPGGLRIQTIHSFCAGLLRRFPLEAGVSPAFAEIEDRAAKLMIDRILDDLAETIAPAAMEQLAAHYTGGDLRRLAEEIARRRDAFALPLDAAALRRRMGLPEGETESALVARTLRGDEADILTQAAAVLATGSTNDMKAADKIATLRLSGGVETLADLESLMLVQKDGRPKGRAIATKATQPLLGDLAPLLDGLAERIAAARPVRLALAAAERAAALHGFAAAFLPEYAARKAALGALDFDDLILRAHALLSDPALGPWVRFRLDGTIDHILVDEAQDTSPLQWQVIAALAEEFTAGEGAAGGRGRSLFVVGDRKQSIYSFQGADLSAFAAREVEFAAAFDGAGAALRRIDLEHSFRSSPAVLAAVDATFDAAAGRALDGPLTHIAHHAAMPGRVDLWPAVEPAEKAARADWHDPVDLRHDAHHAAVLADRIAAFLTEPLAAGAAIPDRGNPPRRLTPGDVLILVRKRSTVFSEVIRALKAAGLPVAGADRLRIGAEIAVRDITAVLSVLALPADDLSLAAALRSPLFGLDEDAVYRLAHGRPGTLWQALRDAGASPARDILGDLMAQADFLRPFDLIERLLTRHDGRRRLIGRLGTEAEDGIDALLAQALAYERQTVPSLTGFLDWLAADEVEMKRRPDSGPVIRVMTVHGAKGLEAPLVILPDTAQQRAPQRQALAVLADGTPVWRSAAAEAPPPLAEALAAERARGAAEDRR
ncbi:MAG TPA: double-strand break repair helicase AddA, partial [Paracoccaceae bacterium]|nr:double-strand break repair helicase AddA [Paracoccaceae bacterium]